MNTMMAETKQNWVSIKDYQFEEKLYNQNSNKIAELLKVVENNRRNIKMESIFKKRFEDLDEKIG